MRQGQNGIGGDLAFPLDLSLIEGVLKENSLNQKNTKLYIENFSFLHIYSLTTSVLYPVSKIFFESLKYF